MNKHSRAVVFKDKFPYLGPAFWVVSVQYVIAQLVVAAAWANPTYSWSKNAISDLGNTACGRYSARMVCSPLHVTMNLSFVVLGITMMAGSFLIYQEFRENRGSLAGFSGMAAAGFGTVLVGLFPENTIPAFHATGAVLAFLIGNLALVTFGLSLGLGKVMKTYTLLSGIIALAAFFLYITSNYLGLGMGGMERLTGYPQTLWLIVFGIYMSRSHYRTQHKV